MDVHWNIWSLLVLMSRPIGHKLCMGGNTETERWFLEDEFDVFLCFNIFFVLLVYYPREVFKAHLLGAFLCCWFTTLGKYSRHTCLEPFCAAGLLP